MNPSADEYGHPISLAAYSSHSSFSTSLADLYGSSAGLYIDTGESTKSSAPPAAKDVKSSREDTQTLEKQRQSSRDLNVSHNGREMSRN